MTDHKPTAAPESAGMQRVHAAMLEPGGFFDLMPNNRLAFIRVCKRRDAQIRAQALEEAAQLIAGCAGVGATHFADRIRALKEPGEPSAPLDTGANGERVYRPKGSPPRRALEHADGQQPESESRS